MFAQSAPFPRARNRRAHYLFAAVVFAVLGVHVGVRAVQFAPMAAGLQLDLATLGTAVTVSAAGGVITLLAAGRLADRVGQRLVLAIGFAGAGTAFTLLALADSFATLIPGLLLYGLTISFVDLGANTVGVAYEHTHATTAMTSLNAWFSAGAAVGAIGGALALRAGVSYRGVYLGLAAVMAAALLATLLAAIPAAAPQGPEDARHSAEAMPVVVPVWRIPAVMFAITLISITFFGDSALETFLSTYLQDTLAGGAVLSGIGIASYHLAALLGLFTANAALRRFGEHRIVLTAGLLAAAGLLIAVGIPDAAGAISGLLLVGFAVTPIVPVALSLAGRSAPGRSGQALATTTAAGYSASLVSPPVIGLLAQATSLRLAFALLIFTSLAISALATRWPAPD